MADTVMTLVVHLGEQAEGAAAKYITKRRSRPEFATGLIEMLRKTAGIEQATLTAWVDSATGGTDDTPGQTSKTVTLSVDTHGSVSNGDTLTIGATTITWGSGNDVDQGADADAAVTNLAAYINGLAALEGICEAEANTTDDEVDITFYGPPRLLAQIAVSEDSGGTSLTGTPSSFALDTTDAHVVDPITV